MVLYQHLYYVYLLGVVVRIGYFIEGRDFSMNAFNPHLYACTLIVNVPNFNAHVIPTYRNRKCCNDPPRRWYS